MRCEYAGSGPEFCDDAATTIMRFVGDIASVIYYGKPRVCQRHAERMLNNEVRANGMTWQIDRHIRDGGSE